MQTRVILRTKYHCSLEQAFKTPMLCDIAKVHTGFLITPQVIYCTDEADWGIPGSSKKVFAAKSLTQKGGWFSTDKVIERIENSYWKIEVGNFQSWIMGFTKFVGEWSTQEVESNQILVTYTYTLHSNIPLYYPLNWLFTKIYWRIYMKHVLRNIQHMIAQNEPFLFPSPQRSNKR
ncbi:MAG: hypothetical protein KGO82_16600 [Bacteroidota bacterium]|nr:hypothetical protein [Bacteroidota bacterium]